MKFRYVKNALKCTTTKHFFFVTFHHRLRVFFKCWNASVSNQNHKIIPLRWDSSHSRRHVVVLRSRPCTLALFAPTAGICKVPWHGDINQPWGCEWRLRQRPLWSGLRGDAPCPHPQLLWQHLFTSSGLSVCKALLSRSVSYTHTWRTHTYTHTHATYTQRNLASALGWVYACS